MTQPRGDDRTHAEHLTDHRLGRRAVVLGGGVVLTTAALRSTPAGRQVLDALVSPSASSRAAGSVRVERLRRPSDQLTVDVVLVGLTVTGGRTPVLDPGSSTGYLGFVLPGQSLGEAYPSGSGPAPSKAELARPTLLAFDVPPGTTVPYSVEGLLTWTGLTSRWTSDSTDRDLAASSIEAPYRLQVRPGSGLVWRHETAPHTLVDGGPVELWHSRLRVSPSAPRGTTERVTVEKALPTSLGTPLTAQDRKDVVALARTGATATGHAPVRADELILSSLGATLELHGSWPTSTTLLNWDHRAQLGRDDYVRTVRAGFLAPWAHPAALVEETWRDMTGLDANGVPRAVLRKVTTILVREPVVDTSVAFARKNPDGTVQGAPVPFTSVRCLVAKTPPLRQREIDAIKAAGHGIPVLGDGTPLRLPFRGTDWAGNEVAFSTEVRWIAADRPKAWNTWNTDEGQDRTVDLGGQATAVAPEAGGPQGCTTVPLGTATVFVGGIPDMSKAPAGRANFRPGILLFEAQVPAAQALSGIGKVVHNYAPSFLVNQANKGGVVLKAAKPVVAPTPPEASGGGVVQMPAAYQGLSTKVGAVISQTSSALVKISGGIADPAQVFGDLKLLGFVPLKEIIAITGLDAIADTVTTVVDGRQVVTQHLEPTLEKEYSAGPILFRTGPLTLDAKVAAGGGKPAEHSIDVQMTGAMVQLAELVRMPVDRLRVTSTTAAPFDLQIDLGQVDFLKELAFVQRLAEVLAPFIGANRTAPSYSRGGTVPARRALARHGELERLGAPDVDVDTTGIHLREDIAIPDVALGAFTVSGIGFGLGIDLLFAGKFVVRFNFATHEHPFAVCYGPFGGGGYTAIELTGGKLTNLEVSLMVAGAVGINLGVAAGAITASAGFVLAIPSSGPLAVTAFFRATGQLEVLGLVSLSVIFEIALKFAFSDPVVLTGTATLSLKVEVLFVSKTVTASVSKSITGGALKSPSKPTARAALEPERGLSFENVYPTQDLWDEYCRALSPRVGA